MNPTKILKTEYQELNYAITDGGHEYHCFYLATVNLKTPRLRTVVLRSFDKNKNFLSFHTDLRSNKIKEIRSMIENSGSLDYTKSILKSYTDLAKEQLNIFPESKEKQALIKILNFNLERKY